MKRSRTAVLALTLARVLLSGCCVMFSVGVVFTGVAGASNEEEEPTVEELIDPDNVLGRVRFYSAARISELEAATEAHPEDPIAWLELGDAYRPRVRGYVSAVGYIKYRRNWNGAKAAYDHALAAATDPDHQARAIGGIGRLYQVGGEYSDAAAQFATALALSDEHGLIARRDIMRVRIGELAREQGDAVEACRWLVQADGATVISYRRIASDLVREMGCGDPVALLTFREALRRARRGTGDPHDTGSGPALYIEAQHAAERAQQAFARGEIAAGDLATELGDFSSLVFTRTDDLRLEGSLDAEAVARRSMELDPTQERLAVYLVAPLVERGRFDEADVALDVVLRSWTALEPWALSPARILERDLGSVLDDVADVAWGISGYTEQECEEITAYIELVDVKVREREAQIQEQ